MLYTADCLHTSCEMVITLRPHTHVCATGSGSQMLDSFCSSGSSQIHTGRSCKLVAVRRILWSCVFDIIIIITTTAERRWLGKRYQRLLGCQHILQQLCDPDVRQMGGGEPRKWVNLKHGLSKLVCHRLGRYCESDNEAQVWSSEARRLWSRPKDVAGTLRAWKSLVIFSCTVVVRRSDSIVISCILFSLLFSF